MADISRLRGIENIQALQEKLKEDERNRDLKKQQEDNQRKERETLANLLQKNKKLSAAAAEITASKLVDEKHKNDEKIKIGDELIDMNFIIANSLQLLYAETDPVQEYYAWIDEASKVIAIMNDGEITHEDIQAKMDYLDHLDHREDELKAVMSIYRGSNFEGAKKQLAFLNYKWQRLMELRSLVKNTTKNHVTEKSNEAEKSRADAALAMLPLMAADEKDRSQNGDLAWDAAHQCLVYAAVGYFAANRLDDVYGRDNFLSDYKQLINNAGNVINHMNDNEITAQDMLERREFFKDIHLREAALLTHMALYEGRSDTFALRQKAYLKYKWERLMEINNAVQNNTKSEIAALKDEYIPEGQRVQALATVVVLNKLFQQEKNRWKNGDYALNTNGVFQHEQLGKFSEEPLVRQGLLLQYGIAGGVRFSEGLHQAFMDKVVEKNKSMSVQDRINWINRMRGIRSQETTQSIDNIRKRHANQMFTIDRYHQTMSQRA